MKGGEDGWALIERYGFNEPPEVDAALERLDYARMLR